MLSILKKWFIVGSSAPSHVGFGIVRFRTNIWHFITALRLILLPIVIRVQPRHNDNKIVVVEFVQIVDLFMLAFMIQIK